MWQFTRRALFITVVLVLAIVCGISAMANTWGQFFSSAIPAFALLLVYIGWEINYHNGLRICSRNELHQLSLLLVEKLDQVDRIGCEFWSMPAKKREEVSGVLVVRRFSALLYSVRVIRDILKDRKVDVQGFSYEFSRLTDALTFDAEDPALVSDGRCSSKIERISSSVCRMRAMTYDSLTARYPHTE